MLVKRDAGSVICRVELPASMAPHLAVLSGKAGTVRLLRTIRQELGRRPFAALLTAKRGNAMANIRTALDRQAREYGAQIIDVRIKRADLPDGSPLESALQRMRTARQQEATTIRANGQKDAQIIRAEADARAAEIYAQSFNKDPQFYDFWRAMQSYRTTFIGDPSQKQGDTSIILSPDNDYLREFRGKSR